jgi:pimeloyl-ACP methyl ester carboxylesterase
MPIAYYTVIYILLRHLTMWGINMNSIYRNKNEAGPEGAEPLILFHGFGFSSTMWIENIKPLHTAGS